MKFAVNVVPEIAWSISPEEVISGLSKPSLERGKGLGQLWRFDTAG